MVDRINNAAGVLGALKHLQSSGKDLSAADTRLASGLRVARASDDATAYHAAAVMRGQGGTLNAVTLSLSRAESISDTAIGAGEQIDRSSSSQMKETVIAAQGEDLDGLDDKQRIGLHGSSFADAEAARSQTFVQQRLLRRFQHPQRLETRNGVSFIADSEANVTLTLEGPQLPAGPRRRHRLDAGSTTAAQRPGKRPPRPMKAARPVDQECRRGAHRHGVRAASRIESQKAFVSKPRRCAGRRRWPDGRCTDLGAGDPR